MLWCQTNLDYSYDRKEQMTRRVVRKSHQRLDSRLVHAFCQAHDCSAWWRQASFSSGKRINSEVVSISMPRKIRDIVGPFNFSIAGDTSRSSQAWKIVSRLREPKGLMLINCPNNIQSLLHPAAEKSILGHRQQC